MLLLLLALADEPKDPEPAVMTTQEQLSVACFNLRAIDADLPAVCKK